MKTIAVLTDFSKRAENAARYALQLAQQLRANIILYNSFLVPAGEPLAGQVYWSMEDFNTLQKDSEQELDLLAGRLKEELTTLPAHAFKPAIHCQCQEGPLYMHLDKLMINKDIILLVMGTHRKGLSSLIMGNHMRDIISNTTLPVLIIPEDQHFKKIDTILFATDMSETDLEVLQSLTQMAKPSYAQITLAHICARKTAEKENEKLVRNFLEDVANKINYDKIYYREVKEKPIKEGLKWLTNNVTCSLFVMVHRHKSFLEQLFNSSNTQKMAANASLPLLVYPCSAELGADIDLATQENRIASVII